ncbi:MAG TPA: protein kinase [Ktedonobacteraceae bacterium]|nr:protein kinase [Ktedonobacteraceae bacterium]
MEQERLGKYEMLERLGRGGMGEVWKARDTQLRRYVAIKLLHADLQANPDFVKHFMREAQLVASLRHPNIVQIHDFQLTDAQGPSIKAYMVMDYIEGGTLADYIRNTVRKGLFPPPADIVYLFTVVSLALDYAHEKGMIHRDIKPANILLDKTAIMGRATGEPILTDFGIARLQGASTSTVTRALIGTPLYMSPEQAGSRIVDERTDLYSLGIILYEMVTGITPFRGDTPIAIMMQHMQEKPTPPDLINTNISAALSTVVLQSIAKDPKARFPTASAMTIALAQALDQPVPANLSKPRRVNEQPDYNPLQPLAPSAGMTPDSPTFTASPTVAATPAPAGYPGPQSISPVYSTPATSAHGKSELPAGTGEQGYAGPYSPHVDRPQRALLPAHFRRRSLLIALLACVILLLVGAGTFSLYSLLSSKHVTTTTNSTGAGVGSIIFSRSANVPPNTFDQLQINLTNIPPPPAGKTYYAWLESSTSTETNSPHWKLQVSNGGIHALDTSNVGPIDLLAYSNLFLITEEDAGIVPTIPSFTPSTHLYYASITHPSPSPPAFQVRPCPSSSTGNPCS